MSVDIEAGHRQQRILKRKIFVITTYFPEYKNEEKRIILAKKRLLLLSLTCLLEEKIFAREIDHVGPMTG